VARTNQGSKKDEKPAKKQPRARRPRRREGKSKRLSRRPSRDLVDHKLMKVLGKPERARILAILAERVASPKEISEETGQELSSVAYHVKVLRKYELIELERKEPRRGAVEHFYRAISPTLLPPGAWDNLPPAMRKGLSVSILREFFDDASSSLEAGVFDDSASDLSWTPLVLDRPGVEEVGQLTDDFLKAILAVQAKASKREKSKRSDKGAKKPVSATVFLASFPSSRNPKEGRKASATKRR
jgi:DNA-binding transcriptional ArsR family regulator